MHHINQFYAHEQYLTIKCGGDSGGISAKQRQSFILLGFVLSCLFSRFLCLVIVYLFYYSLLFPCWWHSHRLRLEILWWQSCKHLRVTAWNNYDELDFASMWFLGFCLAYTSANRKSFVITFGRINLQARWQLV